jgi:hypothetical protein
MRHDISANIKSRHNHNEVSVETNGDAKTITISPKNTGYGSSINGVNYFSISGYLFLQRFVP